MERDYLFTSESVTEGHPDKICDQISDGVLDAIIGEDPHARVACETLTKTGFVVIAGEITTSCYVDMGAIVRKTIKKIGYNQSSMGFDWETCGVLTAIEKQSPDIAMGVDETKSHEQGAGDQGMMFGFAVDETPELMPMPISLAHKLARRLSETRKSGELPYLRPDGKSQVTIQYEKGKPKRVDTIVVSSQHAPDVKNKQLHKEIEEAVIRHVVPKHLLDKNTKLFINPTGRFVIGGPQGDSGLTGRKIIVDTYGGMGRHGGGAFSGKDPTKVDRSAAYMARHVAKNLVASGLARRAEVQFAYAIGVANPVSVMVDTFGTGTVGDEKLAQIVQDVFPLTPRGIIQYLDLLRPIYEATAAYGHFGRHEKSFTWERTDKVEELKDHAKRGAPRVNGNGGTPVKPAKKSAPRKASAAEA
ncbi:MAG: methionine adenosyltransferase [Deltaproteobacteria bacterium]|nr:methionine adenosyltransferase [Deltaproteobacteria bacterium]